MYLIFTGPHLEWHPVGGSRGHGRPANVDRAMYSEEGESLPSVHVLLMKHLFV